MNRLRFGEDDLLCGFIIVIDKNLNPILPDCLLEMMEGFAPHEIYIYEDFHKFKEQTEEFMSKLGYYKIS